MSEAPPPPRTGNGNGRKIGFGRFDVLQCDIADA
jgi:hypothetical protein